MSIMLIAAAAAGHAEAAGEHAEATLLGLGAEGWVYAGITIFFAIAIFGAKAHRTLLAALDARIAETRKSLDEAAAIRAEAEALLADAKRQQESSVKDAAALIDHARHEASAIVAKAAADTKDMIGRREKMAADKIGAAERAAVEMLRARAASAATAAAEQIIAQNHGAAADKALVDGAIAGLAH